MKRSAKRRVFTTRLKAFNSFSDTFSTTTTKSGWKTLTGTWTSGSNLFSTSSGSAIAIVPLSKSNATVSTIIPSGGGTGVAFWALDSSNYWAAYGYSTSSTSSTCSSSACSGTENYTVTQSCSCPFAGYYYPSTCGSGACSGSENFTNYRSCSCSYTNVSNCNNGSCSGTESFTNYRSCSCSTSYGTCSYQGSYTSYQSLGCVSAFSGCNSGTETLCNGPSGANVCGCPCGSNKHCCYTTVSNSIWNLSGCSYNGQQVSTGTSSNCNSGACSGTESFIDYRSCSCTSTSSSSCNSGACSGTESFVDSRSCSCPQTAIYSSTCGNGACSGTYSYQASRSCSCTTNYARKIRVIKYISGSPTTVGEFTVSSMPTTISVLTNGTSVTVTGSGSSNTYTNSDGTTYKNFGILKTDGGAEQSTAISSFTALVS